MLFTASLDFHATQVTDNHAVSGLIRFVADVFGVDGSTMLRIGHDQETISFGWWRGDDLVANISLYPRRLCVDGEEIPAFGIQSVGTVAFHRGQGLFTDLIRKNLAYADAAGRPVIFAADKPHLYQGWGFRHVPEHAFVADVRPATSAPRCRRLNMHRDEGLDLIRSVFATRAPTSRMASTRDHPSAFILAAMLLPDVEVFYMPRLKTVVAARGSAGKSMEILKVAAESLPDVQDITNELAYNGQKVTLHLTPDLLAPEHRKITSPYPTPLLVRGSLAMDNLPLMLSRVRV